MSKHTIGTTTKGNRVWLQGTNDKYGWPVGARYDVTYTPDAIILQLSEQGKRKVSTGKGGVIDLVGKKVTQWAQGAQECTILSNVGHTRILIVAE